MGYTDKDALRLEEYVLLLARKQLVSARVRVSVWRRACVQGGGLQVRRREEEESSGRCRRH